MNDQFFVRNPEVEKKLHELGRYLTGQMPKSMGFTLLMSDLGDSGATFYISSIERDGALRSMVEFLGNQGAMPNVWLIWSNEHRGWWAPNRRGYTTDRAAAGRYSFGEAAQVCLDANKHPHTPGVPNETMVQDY